MQEEKEILEKVTRMRLQLMRQRLDAEKQRSMALQREEEERSKQGLTMQDGGSHQEIMAELQNKKMQLMEIEEANKQLRIALMEAKKTSQMTRVEAVEERAEEQGEEMEQDSTSSKLDLILAQSLQMQSIFMAYMMKDQNSVRGGAGERWREGGGLGEGRAADTAIADPSMTSQPRGFNQDNTPRENKQNFVPPQNRQQGSVRQLQDEVLNLNQRIAQTSVEAKTVANEAVEKVKKDRENMRRAEEATNDTRAAARRSSVMSLPLTQAEEEEEEEVAKEETVDDGDEIKMEEIKEYLDISRSWLRKVCQHVINVLLFESGVSLEIMPPFKGSLWKTGLTESDVTARVLKLGTRCKAIINALITACTQDKIPSAIVEFLRRLVAHRQKYPDKPSIQGSSRDLTASSEKYLMPVEEKVLELDWETMRAGEIDGRKAKFLMAQFLFTRILILQLTLTPWKYNIGPNTVPSRVDSNNLKIVAFLLYHSLTDTLAEDQGGMDLVDEKVAEAVDDIPGDKTYFMEQTHELQLYLRSKFKQLIEIIFTECFPQGKPPMKIRAHSITPNAPLP
mmetsp:Transcript_5095/g.18293  ORF Transcript_5095/g.18293 Transcript_5095/m.18293 type:complete len:565 (-) Transcript_5095:172-1866(-)